MGSLIENRLIELQGRLAELETDATEADNCEEIKVIRSDIRACQQEVDKSLDPWQKTHLARHPARPYLLDFVSGMFTDWTELHGDRRFADDPALVCGFAWFHGRPVAVIGHQKGRDTKQMIRRNFGMPKPEGYRKALRVMQLAERFGRPVLSFVDTPGAYPGLDAEERGQAEAIAVNLMEMARITVPIIATITGEGGSGGALAIAVGDRVNMLEHSVYSVISPEGCASILWRDSSLAETAAQALGITAAYLREAGIVDEIVPEPPGGAHTDHEAVFRALDEVLVRQLDELCKVAPQALVEARYQKFRRMGQPGRDFIDVSA